MVPLRAALALSSIAALAGCFATMNVRDSFTKYGLDRAAFEMECPKEQLQLTALNKPLEDEIMSGTQIGVTGCGKRSVYVAVSGAGWVLNGGTAPSAGP